MDGWMDAIFCQSVHTGSVPIVTVCHLFL